MPTESRTIKDEFAISGNIFKNMMKTFWEIDALSMSLTIFISLFLLVEGVMWLVS